MDILSIIESAITAINSNAQAYVFEKSRDENQALEYTTPVVVIFPDWTTTTQFSQGFELLSESTYNIDFKQPDEWDNSDGATPNYSDRNTMNRINEMEILCNSIFSYISFNIDQFGINQRLQWTITEPIVRENNGTMSGIRVRLTVDYNSERVCSYE